MRTGKGSPLNWGNLRHRAEELLRERKLAANLPLRDPERSVHELEVHQIELEIQNEELREARLELEAALARYTEIFDFAPIGYVTITLEGIIREINHAAARLLGSGRAHFTGQSLSSWITARTRTQFAEMLRCAMVDDERQSCDAELLGLAGNSRRVQLRAALLARAEPLILITLQEAAGVPARASDGKGPGAPASGSSEAPN